MALTNTAQSVFSVTIKAATGTVIMDNDDIRECYFIEDIYSYLKTGCLYCRDTRGLSEFLPLVGNEKITIEYGSADGQSYEVKKFTFDIIKLEEIESTNEKHRHFLKFFFIDKPHKRLHFEHYSRSFMCMKYTEMIAEILDRHAGMSPGMFLDFEHCKEELHYFYTGLKTVAQNVEWLASRCSGDNSGQPGHLLYSSTQNEGAPYNFVTLELLLKNKRAMPPRSGPYTIASPSEYNINKIINYKDNRVDKRSLEKLIHYVGLGYDILRKRYLKNIYTYQEGLDKFTCLGDFSLFEKGYDAILSCNQELTGEFEEEEIMKNIYFGDWIKRYCLQHTVAVTVEGHCARYCGGMIEVVWPSANDEETFDKTMNGLFLVKSVTHAFNPLQKPVYTQKMVLIKNGYANSDGKLTPAAKVNNKMLDPGGNPFNRPNVRGL